MCPLYVFENMKVLDTALFKVFSPILGSPFIYQFQAFSEKLSIKVFLQCS